MKSVIKFLEKVKSNITPINNAVIPEGKDFKNVVNFSTNELLPLIKSFSTDCRLWFSEGSNNLFWYVSCTILYSEGANIKSFAILNVFTPTKIITINTKNFFIRIPPSYC